MRGAVAVLASLAVLLSAGPLSGCTPGGSPSGPAAQAADADAATEAPPVPQVVVAVDPPSGAVDAPMDQPVTVTATDGTLTAVTVTDDKGRPVKGEQAADARTWTSTGALRLARSYSVEVTAVDAGGLATQRTSTFATPVPRKEIVTSISPLSGQSVGVGMPIVVRFNAPVKDRAAVEAALTVTSRKTPAGAWSWVGDEEVHYRPENFWATYDDVRLDVGLKNVDAGRGLWGTGNRTIRFSTGPSMVSTIDVTSYTLTVRRNGEVARVIPVSTGKNGFLTRGGTKVILEKHTLKVMDASTIGISAGDPEYYRLDVPYAMRVTWSGEFVHAAPWSSDSQGRANVSHGCVGMSTSDAIWLFNRSTVGDVVTVVGSPRKLEPGNGYTDWNVPWEQWRKGSALPL